jgi:hypothetical protein
MNPKDLLAMHGLAANADQDAIGQLAGRAQ